ncbi:hypothetical protein A5780_19170 [Nocardia sp. 852002-20019_SCH5090214]|uniref:hypothetical protein n=1 Tax=Nocardia sp. 852002-20019_SCH5090214 TaxID=1834087 RepID=UPI0007EAE89D|nr:hypothetical protein [Nocardia sp. 852002-20019_SCH5090214]OBA62182.1 hypothetical protein A5780_19170 [Nocardia sp. 852002-20019_SCH5090214]
MTDTSFPAHISVDRDVDINGLPVLTATVTPDADSAALPLPDGPDGPIGDRGSAQAPFIKVGTIANAGARPTGLGADDRGKWWHRLDDNGMDFWTGTSWVHSPDAVGDQGSNAPATTITTTTLHDPALTVPAVKVTGSGPDLAVAVTVPAGLQGIPGPAGASGAISDATDYDDSTGPTQGSVLAYNLGAKKWRVQPPPGGFGPWSWWGTDFAADQEVATDKLIAGTFTLPALPFQWRPVVYGHLAIYCQLVSSTNAVAYARLNNSNGIMLATAAGARIDGSYNPLALNPTYGDEGTKPLSPSSTYATVPAYQSASIVVTVERVGSASSTAKIGYRQSGASLVVWAMPV